MTICIYDGSFEGFLTVIFEVYFRKFFPDDICPSVDYIPGLLDEVHNIQTSAASAERVWFGLEKKTCKNSMEQIYEVFLSELPGVEMLLYRYIQLLLKHGDVVKNNFAQSEVLRVQQIHKQIGREVHRMHAFVRFRKNMAGVYIATVDPDFNVLPLIGEHFEKRYADQHWLIFDTRRKYGLLYDQEKMNFVEWPEEQIQQDFPEEEKNYEVLWRNYFKSINITERKNTKLHLRHMPKRYWKNLTEKKPPA